MMDDQCRRITNRIRTIPQLRPKYSWDQSLVNKHIEVVNPISGKTLRCDNLTRIYSFPICPPEGLPKVRTAAVAKPLGTRMVTMGSADLHCLKSLQVAMWESLPLFHHCFEPTHGKNLDECLEKNLVSWKHDRELNEGQFVLSGDYESATDGLNMDITMSLMKGILSNIEHEPTRLWALYETGEHIIEYPDWTKIEPVRQTTGQLMGSLLSFPLLCLANYALCKFVGIQEMMINGDDLLALCSKDTYQRWRDIGPKVGLVPSVGKNFISREFGTFNSQIFFRSKHIQHLNFKLVQRQLKKREIDSCFRDLKGIIPNGILVKRNRHILRKIPQSIDVPCSKGGLGYEFLAGRKPSETDKLVYLAHCLKKARLPGVNRILSIPDKTWISYPVLGLSRDCVSASTNATHSDLMLIEAVMTPPKDQVRNFITFRAVKELRLNLLKNKYLREHFHTLNLQEAPDLDQIKYRTELVDTKCVDLIIQRRSKEFLTDLCRVRTQLDLENIQIINTIRVIPPKNSSDSKFAKSFGMGSVIDLSRPLDYSRPLSFIS